jgi:inosose dehydratase
MAGIRVGNAPVSWGVYEAHLPNPPYAQILDAIQNAGYEGTELGPYGYLPTDPKVLEQELKSRNLALGSSFVPVTLEDPSQRSAAVEHCLKVGSLLSTQRVGEVIISAGFAKERGLIAGRVPSDNSAGWTDSQWKEASNSLHAIARALRDKLGMRVVVHHHAGTYVETPWEIDRLLAETDPELVNLLLDTGHCVFGGGDPLQVLQRHGKRVTYVHFKDAKRSELDYVRAHDISMDDAWKRGVFCPLGEGVVDFPRVVESLRGLGYSGWVIVEQDVVPDANGKLEPEPTQSARQSRAFLRDQLGLR